MRTAVVDAASEVARSFTGVVAERWQGESGVRVSGKILERLVDTGQTVKRRQPLMRLDPIDLGLQARAQQESGIGAVARPNHTPDDEAPSRDLVAVGPISPSAYKQCKAAAESASVQLSAGRVQDNVARNAPGYGL
ncbi:efflux RND transporter periplasmic adaptor subunit, partial [Pseudomonas sp. MWU12-2534b]